MDRIILKRERRAPHELTAFILDAEANPGMILCYAHIGQHSEASIDYYHGTRPVTLADDREAQALVNELEAIGYRPQVVKRRQFNR